MLFKADWSGHCKHFKPTWEKISNEFNKKFNFIIYDADKQTDVFHKYKVDSFPTILVKDRDVVRPYDGDRSEEELRGFLNNLQPIN
jgi:protein disulfide-isomerase A6